MAMLGAFLPFLAAALSLPEVDAAYVRNASPGATGTAILVEIFVAPDRTVESCRFLFSNFPEAGNRRVCDQARNRRASEAAKDGQGNPVHGFTTFARIARVGGQPPRNPPTSLEPAYMEIDVADLPGRDTRKSVYVTVLADAE